MAVSCPLERAVMCRAQATMLALVFLIIPSAGRPSPYSWGCCDRRKPSRLAIFALKAQVFPKGWPQPGPLILSLDVLVTPANASSTSP